MNTPFFVHRFARSIRNDTTLAEIERVFSTDDINVRDEYGYTPFHRVTTLVGVTDLAQIEILKVLLRLGANINTQNNNGCTPLHMAQCMLVAKFLLENGADPTITNVDGLTAREYARSANVRKFLHENQYVEDIKEPDCE